MFNLGEDKFQFHSFRVFQLSNMQVDKFNMDKHMEGMTRAVEQVLSDPRVFIFQLSLTFAISLISPFTWILISFELCLTNLINKASFVAVDCELSGLGDRKKLNAPTIDERYKNTSLVAKTRLVY